ncbi:scaffolding protein [Paenibacillus sp. VCA1]|uniref:phage scaffolding protein n=1 Tax=Paenibacillus sp. VCA1 TaxID=3039148 RepID=UPI002870D8EE|nr:scaffolding protein [Paenibacillus sp. VCA1]MDR9852900.1 scaffolding protein [Paenibacillus sp. VCA1]
MKNEANRYRYPLNLQLFAEEDPHDPNPAPPADPNPPANPEPEKTFSQAEVDEIVAKRLARDRKGREDYDDIKAKLAELEKSEEERKRAEMTAAERLEAEKAEALKAAEEAKSERDKALNAANQRLIKAEFRAVARELNVRSDALDDALVLADLSAVKVDEEGNITGMADVVKALLTNKPYLAEQSKPQPKPIGGASGGNEPTDKTKEQLLKEAADKARQSGRLEDQVAYAKLKRELGI